MWVCGGWVVGMVVIREVEVGFGYGFVVGSNQGCWGGGFCGSFVVGFGCGLCCGFFFFFNFILFWWLGVEVVVGGGGCGCDRG